MISVLVYGRNDARGYGMHKRVAISLNTIAEVLSAPTSEILFVDYNTPNHLPTLPELLRDMLTENARLRTRVMRVRPSVHARFAPFSPLPVLEPIARNVGLRRSRPQNPWILSTNTDAIFVSPPGRSLCDVVRDLPGTHYGAPRFELPERLWEALDRMDPVGTLDTVALWGRKARLNEIVHGQGAVQFDNPGDFQLVRRSALFAVDGFDEEALLGWHVDHNLAHRLNMKYGPEGSLADQVQLYHCGHARQATATHSHDRVENDVQRFVHQVRTPAILRQRDAWGCIDDLIGEVDLRQPTTLALLDAIEGAIPPLAGPALEASYTSQAFDTLRYDAGHVAVYLLDLLSTFPRGVQIGYAGCRRDLMDMLASGLVALGFTEWLAVPAAMAERLGVADGEGVHVWADDHFASKTGLPIFEFGLIRDETGGARATGSDAVWTEEESAALAKVAEAFLATVQHEREADAETHDARMLVVVNAVNSRFEAMVNASLDATPNPFTTRLRYGVVLRSAGDDGEDARNPAASSRMLDAASARAHLSALLEDGFDQAPAKFVLASHARQVRALLEAGKLPLPGGVSREHVLARLALVQSPAPEYRQFPQARAAEEADDAALSRPARVRDFDAPEWIAAARRVIPGVSRAKVRRDAWMWERAHLVRGLSASLRQGSRARALLVSEHPDDVVPAIADLFGQLDLVDVRALFGADPPVLKRVRDFALGPHLFGEKLRAIAASDLAPESYDAIILPHSAAFRLGVTALAPLVSVLRPCLRTGGVLAIGGEIAMLGARRGDRPDWRAAGPDGFARVLAERAGLRLISGQFDGLDSEDVALVGEASERDAGLPVLGVRRDGDVMWPAVWFFEARSDAAIIPGLDLRLADLVQGDQMPMVLLSPQATRADGRILAHGNRGDGHVFFGPYLRLPEAAYLAQIVVAPAGVDEGLGPIKLVAEIAAGPDILAQQDIVLELGAWDRPILFELPFSTPYAWSIGASVPPIEIRLWSNGAAACDVQVISLETVGR